MNREHLEAEFERRYGRAPGIAIRAPGRVNLIGEHTDYNDGFVLPIAIEKQTIALAAGRDDTTVRFASLQAERTASIDLNEAIVAGVPAWANYCKGVAAGLLLSGVGLAGCDLLFHSDVPLGGGLSSSASLEVATGLAMINAAGSEVDDYDLAEICQKAEHQFAGAPCGIMDQTVVVMARAGRALLLDCRSREVTHIPFDNPELVLLVADTEVQHEIAEGGYAQRRRQCGEAAGILSLPSLRDADRDTIESVRLDSQLLAGEIYRRARHVVSENERTQKAARALEARDYTRFGRLMYASHASLRDDYEVSCAELDAIVEAARGCPGVYGARMTGGGFGGCAIVLAEADRAEDISGSIAGRFEQQFGRRCPVFATRAAAGAGPLR